MRYAMFLFSFLLTGTCGALAFAGVLIRDWEMALGGAIAFVPAMLSFIWITPKQGEANPQPSAAIRAKQGKGDEAS